MQGMEERFQRYGTGESGRYPASTELARRVSGKEAVTQTWMRPCRIFQCSVQTFWLYSKWNGNFGELFQREGYVPVWVSECPLWALYGKQIGKTSTVVNLCVSLTRIRNVQIAWNSSCLCRVMVFSDEISICINVPGEEGLSSPVWVGWSDEKAEEKWICCRVLSKDIHSLPRALELLDLRLLLADQDWYHWPPSLLDFRFGLVFHRQFPCSPAEVRPFSDSIHAWTNPS